MAVTICGTKLTCQLDECSCCSLLHSPSVSSCRILNIYYLYTLFTLLYALFIVCIIYFLPSVLHDRDGVNSVSSYNTSFLCNKKIIQ